MPQAPQLAGSLLVSVQAAPHWVVPLGQLATHLPVAQSSPAAQTFPHAPQFVTSEAVSTHLLPHCA